MPPRLSFSDAKAEGLYRALVMKHGAQVVHHAFRIPDAGAGYFFGGGYGDLTATGSGRAHQATTSYRSDGTLHNLRIWTTESFKGHGTKVLARQVLAARKMGLSGIHIPAASGEDGSNGYYTWPRLGFNGAVSEKHGRHFLDHEDFHSLMADPKAAEEWRKHGSTLYDLHFDPSSDSEHSKRLLAYMKEKGIKV